MGKPALMQLQLGTDDDDGTTRVVDALAEQVLTEAALLALEHVGQRLERTLVGTGDGLAAAAVVEERVDRFLQHALFVADDDLGSVELLQTLQPVVAVDDAAIEIVEIRGRETATVERHERTQIRRNDRDHFEHHPLGLVARLAEGVDDLEALGELLALGLGGGLAHLARAAARTCLSMSMTLSSSRMASPPMPAVEGVLAHLFDELGVALLGEDLTELQPASPWGRPRRSFAVQDLLEVLQRHVEQVADTRGQRLAGTRCAPPAWPG